MDEADRALWRALQPLRSVACWLMTGAHPDDEWNGFLGWLRYGRGVSTVYACATRGEGGQNALGPERGRLLGALRSREMELAAGEIGLAVRWIGAGPGHGVDDTVFDFGFSKSGEDTLRRWGAERLRERLVRVIRRERPDAVSPTFLDVPGQHGHHRAVTRTTLEAVGLAGDPAFMPAAGPAWRVAKVYLPAFSGAGASYDDEVPPPAETVRVDLGVRCAALGESWAQLGERSRRWHASQGMGRDLAYGPRPFGLHLLHGVPDAAAPLDGVAHGLGDLAGILPGGPAARALRAAGEAVDDALAAFPRRDAVAAAVHRALGALEAVQFPPEVELRVDRKRRELGAAAALALGIGGEVSVAPLRAGGVAEVALTVRGAAHAQPRLPDGWQTAIPGDAAPFGTLRDGFDPLGGNDLVGAALRWVHGGSAGEILLDPPGRVTLAPAREVAAAGRPQVRREASTIPVVLPEEGARLAWLRMPHAGHVAIVETVTSALLRAPIAIDAGAQVGVIGGEADETLGWLRQLDIAAEAADAAGELGRFDVLLVGVFGFGQVPGLLAQRARLVEWTEAGGSLVTLYHRPGDGWNGGRTPPLRLEIGTPSLRWRVTDPGAPVRMLVPEHPLLAGPNRIDAADWDGWVRERGLYFASAWDPAYVPLLAMADAGEAPLLGGLLAAPVGRGRHVHVALALHHQLAALVPGAFRLLANLVARQ